MAAATTTSAPAVPAASAPAAAAASTAIGGGGSGSSGAALFDRENKSSYDADVRALVVGYDDLSALCVAALGASTDRALQRVLCVGCGSGQELMALARATRPAGAAPVTVVGVDPAAQMHAIARSRLERELTAEQRARVELVHAYLHDVQRTPQYDAFDAATSVLVMHFLPDVKADPKADPAASSKRAYLESISARLRVGATLFLVDACADTTQPEPLHALMDLWQAHGQVKGLSAAVTAQKKQNFLSYHMVTAERVTELLHAAGFVDVMQLYRGFMFTGFRAKYAGPKPAAAAAAVAPAGGAAPAAAATPTAAAK